MASPTVVISHWSTLLENFNVSPREFYAGVEKAIRERKVPDAEISRVDYAEGAVFTAKREYLRVTRGKHVFDICAAPFGTGYFFSSWLGEIHSPWGLFYLCVIIVIGLIVWSVGSAIFTALLREIFGNEGGVLSLLLLPFSVVFGFSLLFWLLGYMASHNQAVEDFVLDTPIIRWLYVKVFRPNTYYKIDTALMFQKSIHNAVLEVIDSLTSARGMRALSELERKPVMREFFQK